MNGGRHRPPVTRHAVRWLAPGYGAWAVIHERVPSETDLWGRRLLAGSTPTPGMTAPDENRRVSDRAGPYPDKRPPFQLASGPSPVMKPMHVCAGNE